MSSERSATAILLNEHQQILLMLRDDGGGKEIPYPNMWDFPGGRVEDGETTLQCVIREMQEELELKLDPQQCTHLFSYTHDGIVADYYLYRLSSKTQLVQHEGADMQWMTLEEIKRLELAWHSNDILPELEEKLSFL